METPVRGPRQRAVLSMPEGDYIRLLILEDEEYYEKDLLEEIAHRVVSGVYVDVGAHCGNHTTFFALECLSELVVAVEPDRQSFTHLCETVRLNGLRRKVLPVFAAVAEDYGWVETYDPEGLDKVNSGARRVRPADDGAAPSLPLDALLLPFPSVALVKIDVEGMPGEVLRSGKAVLERDRPMVVVEAKPPEELEEVAAVLEPLGYQRSDAYCRTPTYIWWCG